MAKVHLHIRANIHNLNERSPAQRASQGLKRWGWCAPPLRSLSSHHAWKPLVPVLCVVVVLIYGQADRLRNFVAGIFIPQYHYPYAAALCLAQVLISLLALNFLHALGLAPLRSYSQSLAERLLVPAICDSAQAVLSMWAKGSSSHPGLYPLTLRLLPLLTVGWSHCLKLAVLPSIHITILIAILSGISVAITASYNLLGMEPLEHFYALLGLILHSLSLAWLARTSEAERRSNPNTPVSIFDLYYTQLVNQSLVLGVLCLLHPDSPWHVLGQGSWCSLLFYGYLLAILLLGMVLHFLVGMTALHYSPFAAALVFTARDLMQPLLKLM